MISSDEKGPLGVLHLRRFWTSAIMNRNGQLAAADRAVDWDLDVALLDGLGLELERAIQFVYQMNPTYEDFEQWICDRHGGKVDDDVIENVNTALRGLLDGGAPPGPTSRSIESLRLPLDFDPDRLKIDLERLASVEWTQHFNRGDYEGDWSGIPLRKPANATHPIQALLANPGTVDWVDTDELDECDYFKEVIASFRCPLNSVRLLRLNSGAIIKEHSDDGLGFEEGEARIHVPIVTSEDVEFLLDGKRIDMAEGESWYTNVNLPHSVSNNSDIDRVHLVIDCEVNDWLRELFDRAEALS